VTTIIPVLNAERYLERAVRSVFATNYPGIGVVIVDDGSSDRSAQIGRALELEFGTRCRWLRHPDGANHGVSASRNLGLQNSAAEWIAFLDADDYYLPNRFDRFRELLATESAGFDAVYELCEINRETGVESDALLRPTADAFFGIRHALSGEDLLRELLGGQCWAISAVTIRRECLGSIGAFDEHKRIAEDCDLWMRLACVARVLPGNLQCPVSVYFRHEGNHYQYRAEHRLAMLEAMLDSWAWAERTDEAKTMLPVFGERVPAYALRAVVALREAGQPRLAGRVISMLLSSGRWHAIAAWSWLRQAIAISRELVAA
jgi:glycosyltransferase involved in cell wall biosynthesis